MKQPVSESSIVTRDMGAIIGLFALVAINRACIGSFVFGVVVTGRPVTVRLGVQNETLADESCGFLGVFWPSRVGYRL